MGAEQFTRTLEFLRQRKRAFLLTFGNNHIALSARSAYRRIFGNPAGQIVLMDLAKFCRAERTTAAIPVGSSNPEFHLAQSQRVTDILEGRRQVWIRIQDHLRLNSEQLFALYAGQGFPQQQPNGDNDDD